MFFRSFASNGGQLIDLSGDVIPQAQEIIALRNAKLHRPVSSPAPVESNNGPEADWELAQPLEDNLQKLNMKRSNTLQVIDKAVGIDEVSGRHTNHRLFLHRTEDPSFLSPTTEIFAWPQASEQ